ncbi:glycosyltransferase family 2 protein [Methanocella arvoryzae]|uniref:Glycosyltransferase (Family 2) n=1 Tax=Methanocella arvoryzae (strain DSM 22066 / NBRC 105507 / MRE50) TaxID=351160 RepID=Q0W3D1_METAR|nr:glycosyltransferase family 2 protein [Methanocella arvoryzae]CAJ37112.1 putative glycosyltransferase (family 2) [Methanocella arvoryzae MRE50]
MVADYGRSIWHDAIVNNSARPSRKLKIMVFVPCYNEEVYIGSVVLRSKYYTDDVVVIDDGSCDKTAEVAQLAGAHVIRHEVNKGKGAGIKNAFAYAKKADADILVLMDGDGQHNPDEIPLLIKPIISGEADIVNGSRFLVKDSHNVPKYRRFGQGVLNVLTNVVSRHKFTDSQSGFRAFSRNTFDCFSFMQTGMGIESEMLIEAARANLQVKEVQINVRYDVSGSTLNPLVHGVSVAGSIVKTLFQQNYTVTCGFCGVLLLLLGTTGFSFLAIEPYDLSRNLLIGITSVSMLSIILGILCVFTLLTTSARETGQVAGQR